MIRSNADADSVMAQPGAATGVEKPKPGQRRHDDVERVLGTTAVRLRVHERADHPRRLDERARVAVEQEEGRGARDRRSDVHEVDRLAVDDGRELRKGVEPGLLGAPVEVAGPVVGDPASV